MDMATFFGMATTLRRRRGEAAHSVRLFVEVAPEAKAVLDRAAAATGAPKWAVLESILVNLQLDENGRPVWWPETPSPDQGELPLTKAS